MEKHAGDHVRSGVVNAGSPFDMHALTTAEASTYAGIVRLVREAQAIEGSLRAPRGSLRAVRFFR